MLAGQIADAVESEARRLHPHDPPRLRREVPVSVGEGRVDVLAVNGLLVGFEVKSASDGLTRLHQQVVVFSRVLDRAVLVVERRHPLRLEGHLPEWWGLWHAVDDEGTCRLHELRPPQPNPDVEALALAQLLWRDEALAVLATYGEDRGLRTANRWRIWSTVADVVPVTALRGHVREVLRARPAW